MNIAIIVLALATTAIAEDQRPFGVYHAIAESPIQVGQQENKSSSLYNRISQKDLGNGTIVTHNQRRLEPIDCPPIFITETRLLEQPINHTVTSTSLIETTQTETEIETIHITKKLTSQRTEFITHVTSVTKDHYVTETKTRHTTLFEIVPTTTTETTIQRIVETAINLVTKTNTLTATETNTETMVHTSTTTFTEEVVEVVTLATFTTSTIDHFSHTTLYSTEVLTLHLTSFVPQYVTITHVDKTTMTVCPASINMLR